MFWSINIQIWTQPKQWSVLGQNSASRHIYIRPVSAFVVYHTASKKWNFLCAAVILYILSLYIILGGHKNRTQTFWIQQAWIQFYLPPPPIYSVLTNKIPGMNLYLTTDPFYWEHMIQLRYNLCEHFGKWKFHFAVTGNFQLRCGWSVALSLIIN